MRNFLTSEKNQERSAVVWNAFSAMMNSFQTTILLIVLTRAGKDTDSGMFVIAYAVGNLMLQVGKYGVRQFQVTDTAETYTFRDYLAARLLTVALMLLASFAYAGYAFSSGRYTAQKAAVVLLLCLVKAVEAFEDVLHGRLQQLGRLDIAGRILGIRLFLFIVLYALLFFETRDILLTSLISLLVTLALSVLMNRSVRGCLRMENPFRADGTDRAANAGKERASAQRVRTLLAACFPLCASACLNMYVANAPKYIMDSVVSAQEQTALNIVFMPVFVIALLGNFIFQPILKRLGGLWYEKRTREFNGIVGKLAGAVVLLTAVIALAGYWLGLPALELVYGVDLSAYRVILVVFILDGGIIAMHNLLILVITILRRQSRMLYGYVAAALALFLFGTPILRHFGILALCLYFTAVLTLLMLSFLLVLHERGTKE
ncbi:MAG: lipopolysaccharide biosynthesis protein [Lachnospiraceae bacterium]|nr:lipopolysaccharide biosynthesis protein [Lachnospiraceae bacterium]